MAFRQKVSDYRGGNTSKDAVKVLLEYKSPRNTAEMPTAERLDSMATHSTPLRIAPPRMGGIGYASRSAGF